MNSWLSSIAFLSIINVVGSITCYECTSGQGSDCKYVPKSCSYGFFGCVKIAMYSGGIDKMGNTYNEEASIVSMVRGCSILPFGSVDMCEQSAILGYRIVKCTCFNDYCNSSISPLSFMTIFLLIAIYLS